MMAAMERQEPLLPRPELADLRLASRQGAKTENEQPAVEIEDLDKIEEFKTCPKQAKSAIQLNQGKRNHLDKTDSPDCKQFAVDDGEYEEQDQHIGNGQDICGVSLKGPKQNALGLSAHSKKENQNQIKYQ